MRKVFWSYACTRCSAPKAHLSKCVAPAVGRHTFRNRRSFATFSIPADYDDAVQGNFNLILHPEDHVKGTKHVIQRAVPINIRRPHYATQGLGRSGSETDTTLETSEALYSLDSYDEEQLRSAGKLASSALSYISAFVKPGVTPDELDQRLHDWIVGHDCYPSPLNYQGFPKSCCVSVNNIVAHGIPDLRPLEETDILTLDLTLYTRTGFHSDTSKTFCLQTPSNPHDSYASTLEGITRLALDSAIQACGPGVPFREIGRVIEKTIEEESSGTMSVVKQLTGHGIGKIFHMRPWVLHFDNCEPGEMRPGHCFTIEPAVVASRDPTTFTWFDEWTISTMNGARAAQMEHTILITEDGSDILTK